MREKSESKEERQKERQQGSHGLERLSWNLREATVTDPPLYRAHNLVTISPELIRLNSSVPCLLLWLYSDGNYRQLPETRKGAIVWCIFFCSSAFLLKIIRKLKEKWLSNIERITIHYIIDFHYNFRFFNLKNYHFCWT